MTDALPDPIVELVGVQAGYNGVVAIRDIDLEVPRGQILALLGPNGAGKTTLLNVIGGQVVPIRGHVHIAGCHVNGATAAEVARVGLCTIPEGRGIFPNLSVRDNLWVYSHAGVRSADLEAQAYERFPSLAQRRHQLAGTLSGGEQQMLALSRALGTDPAILLIDELSMGLAPMIVRHLYELVGSVAASGVTVVLVEQFASLVLPLADLVAIMGTGRIRWTGSAADAEEVLAESYLGSSNGPKPRPTSTPHASNGQQRRRRSRVADR